MNIEQTKNEISDIITELFPNSFFCLQGSNLGGTSLCIHFALGNKTEWINGIIHNDPFHSQLWIHGISDTNSKLCTDAGIYGTRINGKFNNLGFRKLKTNVTEEKILKMIRTYFTNIKKLVN